MRSAQTAERSLQGAEYFVDNAFVRTCRGKNLRRYRGSIALVWGGSLVMVLCALGSLSVDYGRYRLARSQLQLAADAAARAAALEFANGVSAASSAAVDAASVNTCDGSAVTVDAGSDVEFGLWDSDTRTFTPLSGASRSSATAIRVTVSRNVPLVLASTIGCSEASLTVSAIASIGGGAGGAGAVNASVSGKSNPYLAGMASGTTASQGDRAPAQSPQEVILTLSAGTTLTFDVSGSVKNSGGTPTDPPDGNTGNLRTPAGEHGKSSITAPINSLVGVFLGPEDPSGQSTPPALNYSSSSSRNFTSASPALRQVFFIGDGRDGSGQTQTFVIPAGATRFYLATVDGYGWANNGGTFSVTVHPSAAGGSIALVK